MRATIVAAALALVCLVAATSAMLRPVTMQRSSIEVQFHLRSATHSEAEVEGAFVQRSTPGSALFREHLTQKELVALVGASDKDVAGSIAFLKENGAKAIKVLATNDVVVGHVMPSSNLRAFGLQQSDFTAAKGFRKELTQQVNAAVNVYSVLAIAADGDEQAKVRAVQKGKPMKAQKDGSPFPGMTITPAEIFARYNAPSTPANAPADFTSGVAEFQESVFRPTDISTFSSFYNLPQPTVKVNGPNVNGSSDNTEGTLDLEYITAVSGGINTWWMSQNMSSTMGIDFAWWCDEVLSVSAPPSVVSISWGLGTFEYANNQAQMEADNRAFRKLGLRGITVFAASGDSGPGARQYLSCTKFMPNWPASSPYVTSVGATYAMGADQAEESVSFSGGGFSDNFPTPAYQADAVKAYLNSGNPNLPKDSFFNRTGRAFPDVSALGVNFQIYYPSSPTGPSVWGPVSGTSCASPTFAAIITRINLERKNAGKPALGFLNPAIYKLGKVGQDITAGQNIDKDCFGIFNIKGFPAITGWDAVSGLGTPDYQFLSKNL